MNIKQEQTKSQTDSTENSFSIDTNTKTESLQYNMFNKGKRNYIHQRFIHLKKELKINKLLRKTQIDSLLKKCKSKVFKSIHNAIQKCIHNRLMRLPQHFITNIKIEINKFYLNQNILSIYSENKIFSSLNELVIIKGKEKSLETFLNLKLIEVFEYYINSKQYLHEYNRIHRREGEKFAILFNFIANLFIEYYMQSKGNKPRKSKQVKNKCNLCCNDNNNNKIFDITKERKMTSHC